MIPTIIGMTIFHHPLEIIAFMCFGFSVGAFVVLWFSSKED